MNVDFQRRMQRAALLAVAGTSAASVIFTWAMSYFYTTRLDSPIHPKPDPQRYPRSPVSTLRPTSSSASGMCAVVLRGDSGLEVRAPDRHMGSDCHPPNVIVHSRFPVIAKGCPCCWEWGIVGILAFRGFWVTHLDHTRT